MAWIDIAALSDFDLCEVISVVHKDHTITLYKLEDGIYATSGLCPHQAAALSEGEVIDGFIECPAHHALFDIRTGWCEGGMTSKHLITYPVRIESGRVCVWAE